MKRIVFLGCENSHADSFLEIIENDPKYSDYEVVGVYSDESEPCEKLAARFGAPVMKSYDEAVGRVDAVMITARHGKNHYKYAKPYIKSGVPMFIDKPITVDPTEAVEFMKELRDNGVKICGGSSLRHAAEVKALKAGALAEEGGETLGGIVRAPLSSNSEYGGFWFYAQHLVEMVLEVFGKYPRSVATYAVENRKTVIFRYEKYDVTGLYTDGSYKYYIARFAKDKTIGGADVANSSEWMEGEFAEFDALLSGGEQHATYHEFISPVFVMAAIEKSLKSGKEEKVGEYSL